MSLQHFFLFPLPFRKGARGMVRASLETKRRTALPSPSLRAAAKQSGVEGGHPRAASPRVRTVALSPRLPRRFTPHNDEAGQQECRGAQPRCQGSGGVPQHFFLFPLPFRKGARGMVRASLETKRRAVTPHPRLLRRLTPRNDEVGSGSPEGIAPSGRRSGGCPSRLSNYLYACAGYVKIDASTPVTTASLCLLPSPK